MDIENVNKWELWRNQTLVNRVKDNSTIALEYYTLIKYIVKEYKGRMESIQNPLLHLISHCIELSYKELIKDAIGDGYIKIKNAQLSHSHILSALLPLVIKVFQKLASEQSCSPNDRILLSCTFINAHNRLIDTLKVDTITYRYAYSLSSKKNEDIKYTSNSFSSDMDSPNIIELFNLFELCYNSVAYASYILDMMFPEIEM